MKKALFLLALLVGGSAYAIGSRDVPLQFRQWANEWTELEGKGVNVSCSQGSEFGTFITATVTITDSDSSTLTSKSAFKVFFTSDSAGDTFVTSSNDADAVTAVTGQWAEANVASTQDAFDVISTSGGTASAKVSKSGTDDIYMWVVNEKGEYITCLTLAYD